MDKFKRIETTHCNEIERTATSTAQWFMENANAAGTHAITHNNYLTFFICGQEAFADIAEQIGHAKHSIDLCCWGFDPGMELVRGCSVTWPRGETYGDLLIAAGKRGVRVRLLVWYDELAVRTIKPGNMPGVTHGCSPWRSDGGSTSNAPGLSANRSVQALAEYCAQAPIRRAMWNERHISPRADSGVIRPEDKPALAREEYCYSWYQAALNGRLVNIDVCTHYGDAGAIRKNLATETQKPVGLERAVFIRGGTHHQKPILIDFDYQSGYKAVGYVMGLNSVTDYWDTCDHRLEEPDREQEKKKTAAEKAKEEGDFKTLKPYRDYGCRIDGGGALVDLHNNFVAAWNRACPDQRLHASQVSSSGKQGCAPVPTALLRKAEKSERRSTVQIVRTQPEESDNTIRDTYFQATDNATLAMGYLYLENQYFQYEEWAQRLMKTRARVVGQWNKLCAKAGKSKDDLPIMYVFIVIPKPEREEMIPRTYDTLATLGQHEGMTKQVKLIEDANTRAEIQNRSASQRHPADELGRRVNHTAALPEVVRHANTIDKPDLKMLEEKFGMKICTAMLNANDYDSGSWRYREIYIHSKLLLIDDIFITLGSANLNQRSMVVDSELNLATNDARHARELRTRIFTQLSGGTIMAKDWGRERGAIAEAFMSWVRMMKSNSKKKMDKAAMAGFLLSFEDERKSTVRLG